jgi:uncharacterized protein
MSDPTHTGGASRKRALLFLSLVLAAAVYGASLLPIPAMESYRLPLLIAAAALIVVVSLVYAGAPLFSAIERARARAAYGTHRDVLANTTVAIVLGNIVFLPLLLLLVAGPQIFTEGLSAALARFTGPGGQVQPELIFLALVGLDIALLLVVYLRTVRPRAISESELGLLSGSALRNVGIGCGGVLLIFTASAIIGIVLSFFGVQQTQADQLALAEASPGQFLLLLGVGALLAPLAEEVFFRGYVFRAYLVAKGPVQAYIISALLFAVLHLNLPAFIPTFAIGLILAFLYHRSGSLVPSIVAHALNNGFALTALYFVSGM